MGKPSTLLLASVVIVGIGPACTDPAPTPANAPFSDGTRLKAVRYEIEGAPPYFLRWYDSELGVACSFLNENFPDRPVCFPSEPWDSRFASSANLFADSACSATVVGSYAPGESRYVIRGSEAVPGSTCGWTPYRLFHVGDVVPAGAPLYRLDDSNGACLPATDPNAHSELRVLGPEIPIDSLVSGTVRHDAAPGRIVPVTIAGSDGSVQGVIADPSLIAWDSERQEMVTTSTPLTPNSRWFPTSSNYAGYFANDACSVPTAVGTKCGASAKHASISDTDGCGRMAPTAFFELGAPLAEGTPFYYGNASSCTLADAGPARYTVFSLGAPIPLTSFAPALEVRAGTAQLQVVQAGSPDGPALAAIGLFDRVLGRPCGVSVAAADDTVRCLPETFDLGLTLYFADDTCSVTLLPPPPPDSLCAPTPTFVSRDEPAAQAGQLRRHVYSVGDPYVGMVYVALSGVTGCLAIGSTPEVGEMFSLGPEIPAATFAPVNLVRPN